MPYEKEIPFSHLNLFEHYAQYQDAAHYVNDEDALERLLQCAYVDGLMTGASANLTDRQGKVVVLSKQGKNFSEIAVIVGITKQGARKAYLKAVGKLQKVVVFSPISEGK